MSTYVTADGVCVQAGEIVFWDVHNSYSTEAALLAARARGETVPQLKKEIERLRCYEPPRVYP